MKFQYRNAMHYIAGILCALGCRVHWSLTLGAICLFLFYEVNEDWHLSDQAFRDILEFMIGFFITITGLIIWRFLQ